jgi:hypothetical protein
MTIVGQCVNMARLSESPHQAKHHHRSGRAKVSGAKEGYP